MAEGILAQIRRADGFEFDRQISTAGRHQVGARRESPQPSTMTRVPVGTRL